MAHRHQRDAVRDPGHSAGRIVRALPIAAFLLTLAAGRAAAAPTDPGALGDRTADSIADSDAPGWWSAPGGPGWTPGAGLGTTFAWTLAGHSLGGWSLGGAEIAPRIPWPSVDDARRPLVWSDSVAVRSGADAAWGGTDASLATVDVIHLPTREVRARSIFRIESGDFGLNRYSLMFERGDSTRWFRYETVSGQRDAFGAMGQAGDHTWDLAGSWGRGAHRISARLGQRGAAQELGHAAVSEGAAGQSGGARYAWARAGRKFSLAFNRGLDHREDVIDVSGIPLSYSRREGQENRVEAEAATPLTGGTFAARLAWSRATVRRSYDDAFEARNTTWWGALSMERPTAEGRLRLSVGGGHSSALGRDLFAPAASLGFGSGAARGRVYLERLVHPVWSDLAFGQPAFLQRTQVLGLEAGANGRSVRAEAGLIAGITRDRAIVFPYPIQDVWLRAGAVAETQRYGFALLTAAASAVARGVEVGVSGFALGRDQDVQEPRVEPAFGMRLHAEHRFSTFQNDLGVRTRIEAAAVGERESKTGGVEALLPGYWTTEATLVVTLADATTTLRMSNLENEQHAESWIDPGTGQLALGPGRAFRLTFTWRLFN